MNVDLEAVVDRSEPSESLYSRLDQCRWPTARANVGFSLRLR